MTHDQQKKYYQFSMLIEGQYIYQQLGPNYNNKYDIVSL